MAVNENLRLLRVISNHAQKFVAGKLDICQPSYNRYETDNREVPDDCIVKASELYNIPIEVIKSDVPIVDLSVILTGDERELIKQLRADDQLKKAVTKLVEERLGKENSKRG